MLQHNITHIINNTIPHSILSKAIFFFCIYIPPYVLYYSSKCITCTRLYETYQSFVWIIYGIKIYRCKEEHITSPITQTINMPTRILITL